MQPCRASGASGSCSVWELLLTKPSPGGCRGSSLRLPSSAQALHGYPQEQTPSQTSCAPQGRLCGFALWFLVHNCICLEHSACSPGLSAMVQEGSMLQAMMGQQLSSPQPAARWPSASVTYLRTGGHNLAGLLQSRPHRRPSLMRLLGCDGQTLKWPHDPASWTPALGGSPPLEGGRDLSLLITNGIHEGDYVT